MKLYEKLRKIQSELKAPKGQYNSFGNYSYRSCEDIFEALKPLLKENNLALQTTDELLQIGERYYIKATAILIDEDGSVISNTGYAREEETKKGMDGSQITGASSSYARKYALNGLFLIDDQKDSDTTNKGDEITEKEAKAFTFTTGKHKGKTIQEIADEDEGYLQWWEDNGKDERIKQMITLLTGIKPTEIPDEEEQKERFDLMQQMVDLADKANVDYVSILTRWGVESNTELTTEQMKTIVKDLEERLGGKINVR